MERSWYEGGLCPCCGEPRSEFYVLRLWTCTGCDSWLVGIGHGDGGPNHNGRWTALGRYPLGPLDDVVAETSALLERALSGGLHPLRVLPEVDVD